MRKVFIALILMAIYAIVMPKNLSRTEIYATSFFSLFYGKTVDELLDLKKNLYGFLGKGVDYKGVLAQIIIYPTVNLLFLNYFPFKKSVMEQGRYILGWTVFSVVFERFSSQTRFFYYTKWKLLYSAALYPLIFLSLVANLTFLRKLIHRDHQVKGSMGTDLLLRKQ